jgi:hypothetical protein
VIRNGNGDAASIRAALHDDVTSAPAHLRIRAAGGADTPRVPTGREAYPCFASILVTNTSVRSR